MKSKDMRRRTKYTKGGNAVDSQDQNQAVVDVVKQGNMAELQKILAENPGQFEDKTQDVDKDSVTPEESERVERVIFEDDEVVALRNGKLYKIPPCNFKDARRLMKLLRTVNVDVIIFNFLPTENEDEDEKRISDLYTLMKIAFQDYPEVDNVFIDNFVDLKIARKVIEILIDLNGLKK